MFTPLKWLLIFVGSLASILMFVAASTGNFGGLMLAQFYQLPFFLVGFSMGAVACTISAVVAGAGVFLLAGLVGVSVFVFFIALPVIFVIRQALLFRTDNYGAKEWYPPGLLAASVTCFGLISLTVVCIWFELNTDGIEASIREFLTNFTENTLQNIPAESRAQIVERITPVLPGAIGFYWLVTLVINGVLAQSFVTRFGWNLRPNPKYSAVKLPKWFPPLAAALLIATLILPGALRFFAINAAIIIFFPFLLVGFAVVHVAAKRIAVGPVLLFGFYILMFLFGWPLILVVFLGLIEQIAGLRQRLAHAGEED